MAHTKITKQTYLAYQSRWIGSIPKEASQTIDTRTFTHTGAWLYGYELDAAVREDLRHYAEVKKVVFSFGRDESDTLKIMVHGTNSTNNEALSDYYLLETPIQKPLTAKVQLTAPTDRATQSIGSEAQAQGTITTAQAQAWTSAWDKLQDTANLSATLLHVQDPRITDEARLRSYSFKKEEVLAAAPMGVNIYLGIHGHPFPNGRDLLSVILQWKGDDGLEYYFDITNPCPPCCPACPD